MASSGSYNFATNRDTIITDALLYINAIGEGETPAANLVTESARVLNMLVKTREAMGMPTWAIKRGYILPVSNVSSINTNSHVVINYDQTTIGADEAASQTSITVTSSSDMSGSDQIGIELDDGTIHWTTISSVDDSTTITIASGLASAAAAGNIVYSYTASSQRVEKPIRVLDAALRRVSDTTDTEMEIISLDEYNDIGNSTIEGNPSILLYRILPATDTALETNGVFNFWPRFSNGDSVIRFTYQRPFMDFDSSTDEPDFPQAFYLPIVLELASLLGPRFNVPKEERTALKTEAQRYWEMALETVYEEGSLYLQPDRMHG